MLQKTQNSIIKQKVSSYLPSVEEAAHRTHHAGRPCSEHLLDPPSFQSSQQLLHTHRTLGHLELTLTDTHTENIMFNDLLQKFPTFSSCDFLKM